MNDSKQTMMRYLLGELPEGERAAVEELYFADVRVFDELTRVETALVDDYVRGRLSVDTRRRFEQTYLADARRRDRVRFAEALADRVDRAGAEPQAQSVRPPLAHEREFGSKWWSWLGVPWGPKPILGFAVAALLIVSTGLWLAIESGRARQESARIAATQAEQERRTREAEAAGQARVTPPEAQPPRPADQPPQESRPPEQPRAPSVVTLALAVGPGVRSPDTSRPPTLVIPPGTSEVRLQLTLREHEYSSYQVVLRAVAGSPILRRAGIQPITEGSGAAFTLNVPANRFTTGDYMLTVQGAAGGGQLDDLSQSLFRVEKK